MEEWSNDRMCTELVNEGNASTLSQLHANETMHRLHSNEYANLSNLQDLEPDSRADQIQSQFWRCGDDDEDRWQHPPSLSASTTSHLGKHHRDKEDEPNTRQCQTRRQKCTSSVRLFHERHMQNPAVWQQQRPHQCLCKVHSQTTRLGSLANCAPLAITSLQSPCVVQRQTSRPLLQQLLAAEDYVRPLPLREFQSYVLLGLVREHLAYKPWPACLLCSIQFCPFSCCHRCSRCCR